MLKYKIDNHRRLCINKDLIELGQWVDMLSIVNNELSYLKLIEKQLVKDSNIDNILTGLRRKNTLLMGILCKYEQELHTEFEYGKIEYNTKRAKEHERKRDMLSDFLKEFNKLKERIYREISKYKRS